MKVIVQHYNNFDDAIYNYEKIKLNKKIKEEPEILNRKFCAVENFKKRLVSTYMVSVKVGDDNANGVI